MNARRALALLIVPALALTGCLAEDAFVTAGEHADHAREAAHAWDEQARLVLAWGLEPAHEQPSETQPLDSQRSWRTDPWIGDGRSQAWTYLFTAPGHEASYHVVLAANGTILEAGERTSDEEGTFVLEPQLGPIEDWELGSRQAARTVEAMAPEWPSVNGTTPAQTYATLWGRTDRSPLWILGTETGQSEQEHYVNATSGEYLGTSPPPDGSLYEIRPRDGPPPEGGRFNGTVSVVEPETEHVFAVEREGHPWLTVEATLEEDLGGRVNLTVQGPDGEVQAQFETGGEPGSSGFTSASIEAPQTGAWTAQVSLEEGQIQRYQLDWCASDETPGLGFPSGPTSSDPPCSHTSEN